MHTFRFVLQHQFRFGVVALAAVVALLLLLSSAREAQASHANAGFETGDLSSWMTGALTEGVFVVGEDTIAPGLVQSPLEGSFMARLGRAQPSKDQNQPLGQNELIQQFTVSEPSVRFAYNLWTYDYTGFDRFSIELSRVPSGDVIYSYSQQAWGASGDTSRKNTGWQIVDIPTQHLMGQTVRLEFSAGGSEDNLYAFWAYIDSAEDTSPPTIVDFSGIKVNGWTPSNDPASQTINVTRPPGTGSFTVSVPVLCPDGSAPNSVTLIVGSSPPVSVSMSRSGNVWTGTVQTPPGSAGQSFPLTLVIECPGQTITIYIGSLTLIDPSGYITDFISGFPIPEATVTLQRMEGLQWNTVNPFATQMDGSPEIAPQINPQSTDADGHYGWDVIAGTYRVVVEAQCYADQTSMEVVIPPPVTDLDLELERTVVHGDVDCDGDVDAVDALQLLKFVAAITPFASGIPGADIDCDGDRDAIDGLGVLRDVAGLPPLPKEPGCPDIGTLG